MLFSLASLCWMPLLRWSRWFCFCRSFPYYFAYRWQQDAELVILLNPNNYLCETRHCMRTGGLGNFKTTHQFVISSANNFTRVAIVVKSASYRNEWSIYSAIKVHWFFKATLFWLGTFPIPPHLPPPLNYQSQLIGNFECSKFYGLFYRNLIKICGNFSSSSTHSL